MGRRKEIVHVDELVDSNDPMLDRVCELAVTVSEAVSDVRLAGNADKLRELQREMMRVARDTTHAALVLCTAIEAAERTARIRELDKDRG